MKKLVSLLGLALALGMVFEATLTPAQAETGRKLTCVKNTGNQSVKTICFLDNKKGEIKGFLLFYANHTKGYLVVTRAKKTGVGQQEFGYIVQTYTVKHANQDLEVTSNASSKIYLVTSWEYSDGGTYLEGKTPGGLTLFGTFVTK